ncbi:MAG: glycerol-3-phosphate dehydrogenase/oxidase [Polyangiaceae bacterium]|nr:glycerol-3-phosphate dehydrogenase/oxidase [Polyangiaceae bacterium]
MIKREIPQAVDLAILGGGINGAGLARLAAAQGWSVVLFEKGDYASGTSGKSTKLVHGGLRYLEHGHVGLVYESLRERAALLGTAPHLTRPLGFLLPSYRGDPRPAWKLHAGLVLYDLLAGSRNQNRHTWLSATATRALAPELREDGRLGCGLYFDAQVNDARLVLEDVLCAERHGATCLNYCPVVAIDERRPSGVSVTYRRLASGETGSVDARCLAIAAGPWTDRVSSGLLGRTSRLLRTTRGTHLVLPRLLDRHAVLATSPLDGRVFFVIPWMTQTLVGTTDIDDTGNPDDTRPAEEEIAYLLEGVSHYFPGTRLSRDSVVAAFSGLRPLVRADAQHASSVSREDRVFREGSIVTLVGGKLTTYRVMARKALGIVREVLGSSGSDVPGWPSPDRAPRPPSPREQSTWAARYAMPPETCRHLAATYGSAAVEVLERTRTDPSLCAPLAEGTAEILAQVAHGALAEHAAHLDDTLLRRLQVGYLPGRAGEAARRAARVMAQTLDWDDQREREELARYLAELHPRAPAASEP